MRADNKLKQVKEEVLLFAPYSTSISHLSSLIKGSRSSVYRAFRMNSNLKTRVRELLRSRENEEPPRLTDTKKTVVTIPKSKRNKVVSDNENISKIKIRDIKGDRESEDIIEVEVFRTDLELHKTHHTTQQRIDKSLEICRLIAKGYPVYEACEINELGNTTFFGWIQNYSDIKSMYNYAKDIFASARDDTFIMQSYIELEKQLEERTITTTDKIGSADKNGKTTTHTVIQKTFTKEPNFKAIWKILTTLCYETFGTEREREKARAKVTNNTDYCLRVKTTDELEEELKMLHNELKKMDLERA